MQRIPILYADQVYIRTVSLFALGSWLCCYLTTGLMRSGSTGSRKGSRHSPAHCSRPLSSSTTHQPNCLFCKFASQIYHHGVLVAYQFVSRACKAVFKQLQDYKKQQQNSSHCMFQDVWTTIV